VLLGVACWRVGFGAAATKVEPLVAFAPSNCCLPSQRADEDCRFSAFDASTFEREVSTRKDETVLYQPGNGSKC